MSLTQTQLTNFLDDVEPVLTKISAISTLGSYLYEAPPEEKGRLGIILLEIVGDYTTQLTSAYERFSHILEHCQPMDEGREP
jgi:hypothetical protein